MSGLALSAGAAIPGDDMDAKTDAQAGIQWLYDNMDYSLQKVGPDASTPQDALLVARLLGLDKEIIDIAEALCLGRKVSPGGKLWI